ncbi:hypothetical protein [Eubacterium sp.]
MEKNNKKFIVFTLIAIAVILITLSGLAYMSYTFPKEDGSQVKSSGSSGFNLFSVPADELGFEHLSQMDNSLIRIKGYRITGDDNDYVYFTGGTKIDFDKKNCIVSYFDKSSYDFVNSSAGTYEVISNDLVNSDALDLGKIVINDRKTSVYRDNFVCFEFSEMRGAEWYVPYSLIDWSRSPEHKEIVIDNDTEVCPAPFANHVHVVGTPEEDDEVETVEAYVLYLK